ncbi:MATE family efflux transporter [Steroidobacter agaridevorans]|uniref:Multidrug-efflux transporter n=1 Tax=Steroidobacter agaridevorans TaxID=2695856 RepID=A0A829Y5S1_9GAMM|nr:MATE family efflux transporter [Steroidobacter agaridevorans]GFE78166.1 MATE family efflux transporter [Steroidobacter agaridevorans]GFE91225.1 MATE family efflux transporter [Steroidobacter agaridevorans]
MDTATPKATAPLSSLPAQRLDASGRAHVDVRAIVALAIPFAANSAIQAILNLTDTWFIGRISTSALAAIAAIHWPVIACIALFGGVGLAGQTLVAQAFGGRRLKRASQAGWISMWAALVVAPLFWLIAINGNAVLDPFGLDPEVQALSVQFWEPRMYGAPLGVALWGIVGFFNGIGRPRISFMVEALVCISNAVFAQLFIFELGWGIAGGAWATNCAQALGLLVALGIFVGPKMHRMFHSRLMWRPRLPKLIGQCQLGLPMGMLIAADVLGFAMFQLMQVHLGTVDGAATQVVMMLTSISFGPAIGIAMAGTTLVGQSIGMGDRGWAKRIGNSIVVMCMTYMGTIGLLLGLTAPWLIPTFVADNDPQALAVIQLGTTLMWVAAAYQLFDGLNFACSFSLRGAGDATVPAICVLVLSWLVFVPLAHMLSFTPGGGWVEGLPQFGLGALGGWLAALTYIILISTVLWLRWRSGAWEKIRLR